MRKFAVFVALVLAVVLVSGCAHKRQTAGSFISWAKTDADHLRAYHHFKVKYESAGVKDIGFEKWRELCRYYAYLPQELLDFVDNRFEFYNSNRPDVREVLFLRENEADLRQYMEYCTRPPKES